MDKPGACAPSKPALENKASSKLVDEIAERRKGFDNIYKTKPSNGIQHTSKFYRMRDDLVCVLAKYEFAIHTSLYTPIPSILTLYKSEYPAAPSPTDCAFRSALGRSFFGHLKKCGNLVGIVSPLVDSVNPTEFRRQQKSLLGQAARKHAETSADIADLRRRRAEKRTKSTKIDSMDTSSRSLTFRYMDEFLALGCSVDLIEAKLYPNAKELAESMSAFNAVREYLLLRRHCKDRVTDNEVNGILSTSDPSVTLVAVGDGATPRTAGLFAFRTSWRCVSIDPALRSFQHRPWSSIERLEEYPKKVQDVTVNIVGQLSKVVLVAWHAHVSIREALSCLSFDGRRWDAGDNDESFRLRHRVALVACSCCQYDPQQQLMPDGSPPDFLYEDVGVPGEKRTVKVWQFQESF